jgi:hypothetical protein
MVTQVIAITTDFQKSDDTFERGRTMNVTFRWCDAWVLGVVGMLMVGACSGGESKKPAKIIMIPALAPISGEHKNENWRGAYELAVAQMNEALAGESVTFELDIRDDGNSTATAKGLVEEFFRKAAPVIVTDTSGVTVEANKLNYDPEQTVRIPILCGSCTAATINKADYTKDNAAAFEVEATADLGNFIRRTTITDAGRLKATLQEILVRGPNQDGDMNGDGITKLVVIDPNTTPVYLPQLKSIAPTVHNNPTMLRYENVLLVQDSPTSHDFSKDFTVASNSMNETTGEIDGPPDYYLSFAAPTYMTGLVTAYEVGGYDSVSIIQGSSFIRTSILQALGTYAEGHESTSNELWTSDASGQVFAAEFEKKMKFQPAGYDSAFYDAMVLALLGVLKAALPLTDPSKVTSAEVQMALDQLNAPEGQKIYTGSAEFKKAIAAIRKGEAMNYEGASGPCDWDAVGNVVGRIAHIKVEGGRWVQKRLFDCVKDPTCPAEN